MPILGVCLGHQAIGQVYGGRVVRAPKLMHGKLSKVHHTGKGVFAGIAQDFSATRYHSLVVERASLPDALEITAETADGVIMGLQHKRYPVHGVQFHPESIASEHGHQLLSPISSTLPASERRARRRPKRSGRCPLAQRPQALLRLRISAQSSARWRTGETLSETKRPKPSS